VTGWFQPKVVMLPVRGMQVEDEAVKSGFQALNVESALLFESPTELFARVLRSLKPTSEAAIDVQFRPYVNLRSSVRLSDGTLKVRIADYLERAPAPVLESLAFLLLSKLFRLPAAALHRHRYRMWLNRWDVLPPLDLVTRGRRYKGIHPPAGRHYCLEGLFEDLNLSFFGGMLARPGLGWSRTRSLVRLGHYDPPRHVIVLSRVFDDPSVSRETIEYVMYHEMLHLVHPPEHRGSRRVVHTKAFRDAERRFPDLEGVRRRLREFLQAAKCDSGPSMPGMAGA
jgi:hypothetical protein